MSYFVEPWKYAYESHSGSIKTLCLNLWSYDGTHITKVAEYIDWPFADEEPNYWASVKPVIHTPVFIKEKCYKTQVSAQRGWVFESLDNYPDAKASFEQKGILEAH